MAALAACGLLDKAGPETGFALWAPLAREVVLRRNDEEIKVRLHSLAAGAHDFEIAGERVEARRVGGGWRIDGQPAARVAVHGADITVFTHYGVSFQVIDQTERDSTAGGDTALIEAPMPGLVKAVFASPGQSVTKGDRLAVLEAMKMEHSLLAARDGVVAEVLVAAGEQVTAGAALVRLEAEAEVVVA
jgi:3-methylcrotonyl-CoA carboxylase alpha subunit